MTTSYKQRLGSSDERVTLWTDLMSGQAGNHKVQILTERGN